MEVRPKKKGDKTLADPDKVIKAIIDIRTAVSKHTIELSEQIWLLTMLREGLVELKKDATSEFIARNIYKPVNAKTPNYIK